MKDVQALLEQAIKFFKKDDLRRAIDTCNQALTIDPNNIEILKLIGTIYLIMGKANIGIRYFERIIKSKVTDPNFFDNMGMCYLQLNNLDKLILAEQIFKETLRLHPPVRMLARRTIKECELEGIILPANTTVWVSPEFVQKMPELWSNPKEFDPERFSDSRAEHKRHPFAWFPFGGGAHICLGLRFAEMQTKISLYHLLSNYKLSLLDGYTPVHEVLPIRKPRDDLPLIIKSL